MKIVKVSELTGTALDWVVAKCEGIEPYLVRGLPSVKTHLWKTVGYDPTPWNPSTDWAQGGPIIERENLGVWWDGVWHAKYDGCRPDQVQDAGTPLIAAMRCYVYSNLGNTVEVPDELV